VNGDTRAHVKREIDRRVRAGVARLGDDTRRPSSSWMVRAFKPRPQVRRVPWVDERDL